MATALFISIVTVLLPVLMVLNSVESVNLKLGDFRPGMYLNILLIFTLNLLNSLNP